MKPEEKPKLTEFEEHVRDVITTELCNNFGDISFGVSISDMEAQLIASKILPAARQQIVSDNITDEELAQAKKEAYNDALDKIEYYSGEPTFDDGWSAAIWYLKRKNAQPQNTWKPSEEHLKALGVVIDINNLPEKVYDKLINLYNELKKLREE